MDLSGRRGWQWWSVHVERRGHVKSLYLSLSFAMNLKQLLKQFSFNVHSKLILFYLFHPSRGLNVFSPEDVSSSSMSKPFNSFHINRKRIKRGPGREAESLKHSSVCVYISVGPRRKGGCVSTSIRQSWYKQAPIPSSTVTFNII